MNHRSPQAISSWLPHAFTFLLICVAIVIVPLRVESFGTSDFIQYWSAWKLLSSGQNPYDPTLLYEVQASLTSNSSRLIYSWNPPWTYTLLAPFCVLPFSTSATLWCLFQVLSLFFIAATASRALKVRDGGLVMETVAVFCFIPVWYSLWYGQIGGIFALAISCFLLAVNTRHYAIAGVSLLPLSVKPHLFVLCIVPGILWLTQIARRDARRFLVGALGGFLVLLTATLLIAPSSFAWWLDALSAPPPTDAKMIHFERWMTHTTSSVIRVLVLTLSGSLPSWPIVAVPVVAFVLTSVYFWIRRPQIEWTSLLPSMLCLSIATSGYAWGQDQAVLVLCQYFLLARASVSNSRAFTYGLLMSLVLAQSAPVLLWATIDLPSYYLFILPWALLALLRVSAHLQRDASSDHVRT